MRLSLEAPASLEPQAVKTALMAFGAALLRGVCDPSTLAVYRLAIAESNPDIAHLLHAAGRQANRAALIQFLKKAQQRGQFRAGEPETMTTYFFALLWGDLLIRLLLGVANPPTSKEIEQRARQATEVLLKLFS
jgi:AefR-like transcriptional repressor, C-terminal domain